MVVVGVELLSRHFETLNVLAQKQAADDRRDAVGVCVGVGDETAEAADVGRFEPQLFARHAPARDGDGEDDAGLEELVFVGEVLDALLVDAQVETEEAREELLRAYLERVLLVRLSPVRAGSGLES